ncbi:hypothetical protein J2W17_003673 [Pseudomonas lini]|uniref:hypothetical protein n=1 Tax=Pseudomonas lini TaxID=163011 RepID=UPI00278777C7|nr:hypothetical protein [Pseudomonas lini]MDQ0124719.1 hypothetical protein [Pseudomonas lini]
MASIPDGNHLDFCSCTGDVLDGELEDAAVEHVELSQKIEREADKLLAQIARADSMMVAAKAGARAEGFVLGLESAGALNDSTIDKLYVIFDVATEERLKSLAQP